MAAARNLYLYFDLMTTNQPLEPVCENLHAERS